MSRVITFSRNFPAYHKKAGQPTHFVEKVVRSLHEMGVRPFDVSCEFNEEMYYLCEGKHHTIRAGKRWKVGDWFSPRVWSGKPYASKQIQFAPDIEIKKIWEFDIIREQVVLDSRLYAPLHPMSSRFQEVAKNDGLTAIEMIQWFNIHPKKTAIGFGGQILCWNESIEYTPDLLTPSK